MTEKFILDATAGYRMMWFDKNEPHTVFLDCRPEVKPTTIGDYKDLSQFPNETFNLVVFDPQHRPGTNGATGFLKSYGAPLNPETWQSEFRIAFNEFMRVLKPNGILIFKWSTYRICLQTVLSCFPEKPLFGQTTTGHQQEKHAKTYWFCFMKFASLSDKETVTSCSETVGTKEKKE